MTFQETYDWHKNGTKQSERLPEALSRNYLQIDPRSIEDMIKQIKEYAHNVKFIDNLNSNNKYWNNFFNDKTINLSELDKLMKDGNVQPHLALLLAFLKLFKTQQTNLNSIPERHLDFYYKEILGFKPQKGRYGKATIFMEMAKSQSEVLIQKGTAFDAGKDAYGKQVRFITTDDVTVNKAKIKTIGAFSSEKAAFLKEDALSSKNSYSSITGGYGFCLSSPLFSSKSGKVILSLSDIDLSQFEIEYTGKKGWVSISPNMIVNNKLTYNSEELIAYDKHVHTGGYDTDCPILRFSAKKSGTLSGLSLNKLVINAEVRNSEDLIISNRFGSVPNLLGAMPFGTQCKMNDSFTVSRESNDEITNITWEVNIDNCCKGEKEKTALFSEKKINNNRGVSVSLRKNNFDQQEHIISLAKDLIKFSQLQKEYIVSSKLPIIPTLTKPITIDYSFRISNDNLQIIPFTPFGIIKDFDITNNLFPQLTISRRDNNSENVDYYQIGIENIENPTNLSIYFRINPYKNITHIGHNMQWYYLEGDAWTPFHCNDLLKDSTKSLVKSGVIHLRLPEGAFKKHSVLPNDQLWLKVSMGNSSFDFSSIEDIRLHAAEVVYDTNSDGKFIAGDSLPASSISKFIVNNPGIKKIDQPYSGENGLKDESEEKFKGRVSEKLRHKGKAWSEWDYERLVLDKFPQIATVKCLSNRDGLGNISAGNVLLVLIPDTQSVKQENSRCPSIGSDLLNEISDFLKTVTSPFVQVNVISPQYYEACVTCRIKLRSGFDDKNYYQSYINEQLIKFLSPWADESQNADFSNEQNESNILFFLENLECVDYIEQFSVSFSKMSENNNIRILTSASNHIITIL